MPDDDLLEWVERIAGLVAVEGTPPIAGRALGWLMVCEPAEQSAADIAEAIGASRASLTTNLRLLLTMGFIVKRTRPGERTTYYRVDDNAWHTLVRRQIESVGTYLEVGRAGLDLVGPDGARGRRIRDFHEVFAWMAEVFAQAPPLPRSTDR